MQTINKNKYLNIRGMTGTDAVNVHLIRRAHIARLIEVEGTVTAFAEKVGTNPDYISSIISGITKRNAGSNLMRKIEAAYNIRPGALDSPEEEAMVAAMVMQALPDNARTEMLDLIKYKIESNGVLLAEEHIAPYFKMLTRIIEDRKKKK